MELDSIFFAPYRIVLRLDVSYNFVNLLEIRESAVFE